MKWGDQETAVTTKYICLQLEVLVARDLGVNNWALWKTVG